MPKTTIKPSLASINAIEVTVNNESHTAAAPIVERMIEDPDCVFAAYKIEHPSNDFFTMKIQGSESKNAKAILETSLKSLISDIDDLINQVKVIED